MKPSDNPTDDSSLLDTAQLHRVFQDRKLLENWLNAIEITVSGRTAQHIPSKLYSHPVEITQGLYLGTLIHAKDQSVLDQYHITHLLDCSTSRLHDSITTKEILTSNGINNKISCIPPPTEDQRSGLPMKQSLLLGFPDVHRSGLHPMSYKHISELTNNTKNVDFNIVVSYLVTLFDKAKGNVLIFCLSGINRSAAVCTAILMMKHNMTLLSALTFIRNRVGPIIQAPSLQRQLLEFAFEIAKLDDLRQWPSEENDSDLECQMVKDWCSLSTSEIGTDDADTESEHYSEIADDNNHDENITRKNQPGAVFQASDTIDLLA